MKLGRVMSSSYNLEQWESRWEWPLAGVAAVFLVLYSVQVLAQPHGLTHSLLDGIMYALWAAFAIEYVLIMPTPQRGRASIDIAAPPDVIYDLIADITRMGEWSPECYE
jgi:hypothetical protein